MADNQQDIPESKPDNDNIDSDFEQTRDKAELDSDGILSDKTPPGDKALLDKDGIFDGSELSLNEEQPVQEPSEADDGEKQKTDNRDNNVRKGISLSLKIKNLPLVKYAAIFAGILVLFGSSWFAMSYFLFSTSNEEELQYSQKEEIKPPEIEAEKIYTTVELKYFIIPVNDAEKGRAFLRTKIILNLREADEDKIKKELKSIRLAIYMLLCGKEAEDILDSINRDMIKTELQNVVNKVLKKDIVIDLNLTDLLLV